MSAQPTPRPAPDRRASTAPKRTSILPKPSSIAIDPSVLIAQHAQISGTHPITLGANTILHPHSRISSVLAPVVLGEGVVVYERAKVGVGLGPDLDVESRRSSMVSARSSATMRSEGTVLGANVVVEANAVVEAAEVGEGSVIEVGAILGRGSVVGKVWQHTPTLVVLHANAMVVVLHDIATFCRPSEYATAGLYCRVWMCWGATAR
jgi:dynactin-6